MAKPRKTATKGRTGKARAMHSGARLRVHVEHGGGITPNAFEVTSSAMRRAATAYPGMLERIRVTYGHEDDPARIAAALKEAEILITATFLDVRKLPPLQSSAPHLKWIQSMVAGTDKFMSLMPPGVVLTNASGVHARRGGEYGMTALLMLNSRIPQFVTDQQKRRWKPIVTTPVAGKTLALLGVGAIGGEIAKLAKRFGMRVLGVNRSGKPHRWVDKMVRPGQIAKVLRNADFVLVTLPLTRETEGMLGRAELDLLPRHAGVVNIGRAQVVDYAALAAKLRNGELSGAALDVFAPEPPPADSPIWSVPNLIITPHCALDDEKVYLDNCLDIFFANLRRFLAGRPMKNLVDLKLGY